VHRTYRLHVLSPSEWVLMEGFKIRFLDGRGTSTPSYRIVLYDEDFPVE
jgi:hypothetical protein